MEKVEVIFSFWILTLKTHLEWSTFRMNCLALNNVATIFKEILFYKLRIMIGFINA